MKRRGGMVKRFSDLGIRQKLMLSFVLLVSMPVMILAVRSYVVSSGIVEQKTNQYSHDILYQTTKTMETRLDKIEDISFNVIMNSEVQALLLTASTGKLDPYESNLTRNKIEAILASHVLFHDEINAIYVVSYGGYVYELDKTKQRYGLMEEYEGKIREGKGSTVWIGGLSNRRVIALTRLINSTRTQKPIGYLVMYVEEAFLFDLLKSTYSMKDGSVLIVDGEGRVVSSADKEQLGMPARLPSLMEGSEAYSFSTRVIDGESQYLAVSEPMRNGWRILGLVPVDQYQREIIGLRNSIVFFAALLLALCVLCAWGLSMTIAKPVRTLSALMTRFGQGELGVRSPKGAEDETGQLSESFNQMAENINELIQKVSDERLMKREAELKSLQMQINPHFLYNTLETINWMARAHGTADIGVMVKALGDLMRATINGKDYVTLKDEVVSLQNYLRIQKYRYGDRFESSVDIAPDTAGLFVPKLILQPLVENAIYHGIEPAFEKGVVEISSAREGEELVLRVWDSGVGMTAETIRSILEPGNQAGQARPDSIGLQNVIRRIETLFGNGYGVSIESELGEGTLITVRLPMLQEAPKSQQEERAQ